MKAEWSGAYRSLCEKISIDPSLDKLKDELVILCEYMDHDDALNMKEIISKKNEVRNTDDFIYSVLNFLSRYHEIRVTNLRRVIALNPDSSCISLNVIKERDDYDSVLSMSFLPDGKISFFSYDNDDDIAHSISGYMTQSGEYKHAKKIKSILNILNSY